MPNFNHATRPNFVPGQRSESADRRRRRLAHAPRLGRAVVRLAVRSAAGRAGPLSPARAGSARRERRDASPGACTCRCSRRSTSNAFMLSDRGHEPYEAADLEQPDAVLVVRDQLDGEVTVIPREQWRFRDRKHIELDGGFTKGRIYQCVYTAVGRQAARSRHGGAARRGRMDEVRRRERRQSDAGRHPARARLRALADRTAAPHARAPQRQRRTKQDGARSTASSPTWRARCSASSTIASARTRRTGRR